MSRTPVNLKNRTLAAVLSFLVPGLGQIYQGRVVKGLIFLVGILGLFVLGMALGDWKIVYWRWVNPLHNSEKFYLWFLAQLSTGLVAIPAVIQATLHYYEKDPILWGYLVEPSQDVLNGLYPRLGKLVEMGTIYTEVAGLLNILAVFDAYDGPAYLDKPPTPSGASTTTPSMETPSPTVGPANPPATTVETVAPSVVLPTTAEASA